MKSYQREFIQFALNKDVLCFGEYILKSGRKSPYFFNTGLFNDGTSLSMLGNFYASAIQASGLQFDMLFGPAYKGIPLVSAVAISLIQDFGVNVPFSCNRKEIKDHGEGGVIFGAPLTGNVLIIDDVISAGTSVNLSVDLIQQAGARPIGVAIALDRQERGTTPLSAVQEVEQQHQLKVISIVSLNNMIEFLENLPEMAENLDKVLQYRKDYGVAC